MTMQTERNYVAAQPHVEIVPPRADLVRRQDVVGTVERMLDLYQQQQRQAMDVVHADATSTGYLSSADVVRARQSTSAMYLMLYATVAGMTIAGVVVLAAIIGALDAPGGVAVWLCGTGIVTLFLAWRRHGDEFDHSAEGIARHTIDAHWHVASYEAETRRLALEWEYAAEEQRQAAAAQAAQDARHMAALRIAEMDARRQAAQEQQQRLRMEFDCHYSSVVPETAPQTPQAAQAAPQPAATTTQAAIMEYVASLYADGALGADGVILSRVPWSARSAWPAADKQAARHVCVEQRPALIVQADGGRWRLRTEMFSTPEMALDMLARRL